MLSNIKRRHDPVVTTVAQGILEFKRDRRSTHIDRSIQTFLDRFYMSRIGRWPVTRLGSDLACLHLFGRRHSSSHWPTYRPQPFGASRGRCLSLPKSHQVCGLLTWRDCLVAFRTTVCLPSRPIVYSRGDKIRLLGPELTPNFRSRHHLHSNQRSSDRSGGYRQRHICL